LPYAASTARDRSDFAIEAEIAGARALIGQSDTPRFQGMKSS
jgi:hypothetical protein